MITTTFVGTLILIAVVVVLLYRYVIPSLPDPFSWIASIIVGVALIIYLLRLIGLTL